MKNDGDKIGHQAKRNCKLSDIRLRLGLPADQKFILASAWDKGKKASDLQSF